MILGDATDYFQSAMVSCCVENMPLTTYYIKNQENLDWNAIAEELDLPPDLRWGPGQAMSPNWLTFFGEEVSPLVYNGVAASLVWLMRMKQHVLSEMMCLQISGITMPWLYIGPGFAGMHQEDGMMTSVNISVPVTALPKTDEILRQYGIDFMKAVKVGLHFVS